MFFFSEWLASGKTCFEHPLLEYYVKFIKINEFKMQLSHAHMKVITARSTSKYLCQRHIFWYYITERHLLTQFCQLL